MVNPSENVGVSIKSQQGGRLRYVDERSCQPKTHLTTPSLRHDEKKFHASRSMHFYTRYFVDALLILIGLLTLPRFLIPHSHASDVMVTHNFLAVVLYNSQSDGFNGLYYITVEILLQQVVDSATGHADKTKQANITKNTACPLLRLA